MPNSKRKPLAGADCSAAELPEELIMSDILLKITNGACMGRCRCVCRSWRHHLSGPSLIRHKLQPSHPSSSESVIISSDKIYDDVHRWYSPDKMEPVLANYSATLGDLGQDVKYTIVAGYCNGLFCLKLISADDLIIRLILWNPATSETKVLPPPSSLGPDDIVNLQVGFGYDPESNDYKVFAQFYHPDDDYDNVGSLCYRTEVYSLRKNSWKGLEGYAPRLPHNGEILTCDNNNNKGKLYWLGFGGKSLLLHTVDTGSEAFGRVHVRFPAVADDYWELGFCSGCLFGEEESTSMMALLRLYNRDHVCWEIWMLLRFRVQESWVKLFVVQQPPATSLSRAVGISKNLRSCVFSGCIYNPFRCATFVFDLDTGDLNVFETGHAHHVINYTPSRISFKEY